MAAKKTVPVTSVTPNIKTTPVSKAQQARTRALVGTIASLTPVGRVAKGVATASKVAKAEAKANARGLKAANKTVSKNNRYRTGDGEMHSYLLNEKPARPNHTRK